MRINKIFAADNSLVCVVDGHRQARALSSIIGPNQTLPVSRARIVLFQVSEALGFIHSKRVRHSAVCSQGIVLTFASGASAEPSTWTEQTVKARLLDCGILNVMGVEESHKAHGVVGTPVEMLTYLAPEILCGGEETFKSDVWSLGCVFYEMLAGSTPFFTYLSSACKNGKCVDGQLLHFRKLLTGRVKPKWPPQLQRACQKLLENMLNPVESRRPSCDELSLASAHGVGDFVDGGTKSKKRRTLRQPIAKRLSRMPTLKFEKPPDSDDDIFAGLDEQDDGQQALQQPQKMSLTLPIDQPSNLAEDLDVDGARTTPARFSNFGGEKNKSLVKKASSGASPQASRRDTPLNIGMVPKKSNSLPKQSVIMEEDEEEVNMDENGQQTEKVQQQQPVRQSTVRESSAKRESSTTHRESSARPSARRESTSKSRPSVPRELSVPRERSDPHVSMQKASIASAPAHQPSVRPSSPARPSGAQSTPAKYSMAPPKVNELGRQSATNEFGMPPRQTVRQSEIFDIFAKSDSEPEDQYHPHRRSTFTPAPRKSRKSSVDPHPRPTNYSTAKSSVARSTMAKGEGKGGRHSSIRQSSVDRGRDSERYSKGQGKGRASSRSPSRRISNLPPHPKDSIYSRDSLYSRDSYRSQSPSPANHHHYYEQPHHPPAPVYPQYPPPPAEVNNRYSGSPVDRTSWRESSAGPSHHEQSPTAPNPAPSMKPEPLPMAHEFGEDVSEEVRTPIQKLQSIHNLDEMTPDNKKSFIKKKSTLPQNEFFLEDSPSRKHSTLSHGSPVGKKKPTMKKPPSKLQTMPSIRESSVYDDAADFFPTPVGVEQGYVGQDQVRDQDRNSYYSNYDGSEYDRRGSKWSKRDSTYSNNYDDCRNSSYSAQDQIVPYGRQSTVRSSYVSSAPRHSMMSVAPRNSRSSVAKKRRSSLGAISDFAKNIKESIVGTGDSRRGSKSEERPPPKSVTDPYFPVRILRSYNAMLKFASDVHGHGIPTDNLVLFFYFYVDIFFYEIRNIFLFPDLFYVQFLRFYYEIV